MIDHRTISDDMLIIRMPLGRFQVNTYLVGCRQTGRAVVIDPADEPQSIAETASLESLTIEKIINTHGHTDHIWANPGLQALLNIPAYLHPADRLLSSQAQTQPGSTPGNNNLAESNNWLPLSDGQFIGVGKLEFSVIHTPGHTPGSVCYLCRNHLFTGDTLFVGAVGRTDLKESDFQTLLRSIKDKIITLALETYIWPGHDYGETPMSTIGHEMEQNPYIAEFILCK
jgi:hydroxyacylglutathione hydrolase